MPNLEPNKLNVRVPKIFIDGGWGLISHYPFYIVSGQKIYPPPLSVFHIEQFYVLLIFVTQFLSGQKMAKSFFANFDYRPFHHISGRSFFLSWWNIAPILALAWIFGNYCPGPQHAPENVDNSPRHDAVWSGSKSTKYPQWAKGFHDGHIGDRKRIKIVPERFIVLLYTISDKSTTTKLLSTTFTNTNHISPYQ